MRYNVPNHAGIYEITCGGKIYIGSSMTVRSRLHGHRSRLMRGCHYNPRLQAAFDASKTFAFKILKWLPGETLEAVRAWERSFLEIHEGDPDCCNVAHCNPKPVVLGGPRPEMKVRTVVDENGDPVPYDHPEYWEHWRRGITPSIATRLIVLSGPEGEMEFRGFKAVADYLKVSHFMMQEWMEGRIPWPGTGKRRNKASYRHVANYTYRWSDKPHTPYRRSEEEIEMLPSRR